MKKESVVIFDGEDKFISPKSQVFDKAKGEAEFVGGTQTPSLSDNETNPDKKAFDEYMLRQSTPVTIPSPVEPNFCERISNFIKTNGDGRATPEMIMEAYQLFQDKCVEKPKDKPIVDSPISAPVEPEKVEKVKDVEVPPASAPIAPVVPIVPLNVPSLGLRPSSGSDSQAKEDNKTNNSSNLLLLAVVGIGILYLVTRKSD